MLTPEEIATFKAAVKRVRGGAYPPDWISSGMRTLAIRRNSGDWSAA